MPQSNFSIIIPNYNGADFLLDCLVSITQAAKLCPKVKFELILVDNASTDASPIIAQNFFRQHPAFDFRLLTLNTNTGFAAAVNCGIKSAVYDYVVICNNDLTVDPNWFTAINSVITANINPRIATFFGLVLNQDGTKIESEGLEYFIQGKALNIGNGQNFHPSRFKNRPSEIIWGASASIVIYQKQVIETIGLFDEDFFAYEEDVDLAYRLNYHGYQTLFVPSAIAYHRGGGTSNRLSNLRSRLTVRNWWFIFFKNYSLNQFVTHILPILNQRLHDLSYFIRQTISSYSWQAIVVLPLTSIRTFLEIIIKLPKMLTKRNL